MKAIISILSFMIFSNTFANEEIARLHMDKDWRIKSELKFEIPKEIKSC